MLGYCGLDCSKCDAFIATKTNDDAMRQKIAEEWSKAFNADLKTEHINCEGCTGSGVKLCYCESMCEIRQCALRKKVENCGVCRDYGCETLSNFFRMAPEAQKNLESLRANR